MKKIIFIAAAVLTAPSAFAHHKGFHISCGKGATFESALNDLHSQFHKFETGDVDDHKNVDVDSVGGLTQGRADDGSKLVCTTVTFLTEKH